MTNSTPFQEEIGGKRKTSKISLEDKYYVSTHKIHTLYDSEISYLSNESSIPTTSYIHSIYKRLPTTEVYYQDTEKTLNLHQKEFIYFSLIMNFY